MATLAEAREALAAALTAVEGLNVRPRPGALKAPAAGDGWVAVTRLVPGDFETCTATLTAVVVLGTDQARADERLEEWAVPVIDAVTKAEDIGAANVALDPELLVVEGQQPGKFYALTIALTTPVGG